MTDDEKLIKMKEIINVGGYFMCHPETLEKMALFKAEGGRYFGGVEIRTSAFLDRGVMLVCAREFT